VIVYLIRSAACYLFARAGYHPLSCLSSLECTLLSVFRPCACSMRSRFKSQFRSAQCYELYRSDPAIPPYKGPSLDTDSEEIEHPAHCHYPPAVLNVLGIMNRIFQLHETALHHAVRTRTGRCKDFFGGDRAINDVWTFSMSCAMSLPFQIAQKPNPTLDAEFGPCWYRYLGVDTVFANNMCVQVSQRASIEGARTPLAVNSIGCDVIAQVSCRRFRIVKSGQNCRKPTCISIASFP
jgi:hypothetical protein